MHNILISYFIIIFGLVISVKAYGISGESSSGNGKVRIFENQGGDFTLIGPDSKKVSSLKFRGKVFCFWTVLPLKQQDCSILYVYK